MLRRLGIIVVLAMCAGVAQAGEYKFNGYAIADAYYMANHPVQSVRKANGFQFRRIYLTNDYKYDDDWSTRFRFEASQADFGSASAKMTPVIKDAYLKYKNGAHAGIFGMSGTPTWGVVEKFWGYRSVEKTLMDFQGWGSSRDTGIAVKGSFADKMVGYHAMIGNSESNSSEDNKNKGYYLAVHVKPVDGLIVEVMSEYQLNDQGCTAIAAGAASSCFSGGSKATGQLFVGYKGDAGRLGVQYVMHHESNGRGVNNTYNRHMNGISVFGAAKVTEKFSAFARYDYIDYPHSNVVTYFDDSGTLAGGVTKARPHFAVLGVDWHVRKGIHLIPNIEVLGYGKSTGTEGAATQVAAGGTARSIVIPRLTAYWKFK